jgi:polysaccharide export outer membrane protein
MKRLFLGLFVLLILLGVEGKAQTLNPGDGVQLIFYNISDTLSKQYYIQENGYISLPYLGAIRAANRNIDSLKQEIYSKYSNIYRNPELTILPIVRVNIFGEVNKPGYYYVTATDKLADLIAMAGGPTPDANVNNITLTRNGSELNVDGENIIKSGNKQNDIALLSGDQIYIPRKWFSGATQAIVIASLSTLTALIVALIYVSKK